MASAIKLSLPEALANLVLANFILFSKKELKLFHSVFVKQQRSTEMTLTPVVFASKNQGLVTRAAFNVTSVCASILPVTTAPVFKEISV
jgi:hypothetical protein